MTNIHTHTLMPVSTFFVCHAVTIATAGAITRANTNIYHTRILSSAGRSTSELAVPSSNGVGGSECLWNANVRILLNLLVGRVIVVGWVPWFYVVVSVKMLSTMKILTGTQKLGRTHTVVAGSLISRTAVSMVTCLHKSVKSLNLVHPVVKFSL